jgi:SecD/SecF fusion protein
MKNIIRNLIWTVLALLIFGLSVYPPEEKLKLGKDLRGGVSLVYAVQINSNEDSREVISKTIEVLKNRVDPSGLMEISMVAQGRDRIEVTMPLPGPEVKELRRKFEEELEKLGRSAINRSALESVLRLPGDQRASELTRLADGDATRQRLLDAAAAASDSAAAARQAFDDSRAGLAPESEYTPEQLSLLTRTTDAEKALEDAVSAAVRTSIAPEEVRRALLLPDAKSRLYDSKSKESVEFPSPREQAIERLKQDHPEAVGQLEAAMGAYQTFAANRKSLDDPQDLIRMLRGAGVLSFRISVDPGWNPVEEQRVRQELRERGPQNVRSTEVHWYRLNSVEKWHNNDLNSARAMLADPVGFFESRGYIVDVFDGQYYMLCWDTRTTRLTQSEGSWGIARAYQGQDEVGRPSIQFEMNPRGAVLLGELTKNHVNQKMAVLLDDEVYTAPNLQSAISNSGQIMGDFSAEEITYIIRVLSAGSLASKLSPEPISTNVLGPELGADNLRKGMYAGLVAFVVVTLFMFGYYFTCGVIAIFALLFNALIIMGAMSLAKAAFTMPGIAGIILTFGQAIDSNVLIYERMREEFRRGNDMKTAVRLGYDKAFSSIIDGNITNLIVCVVLGYVGTVEVKGFAITMGIGIVATLFCCLVVSRLVLESAIHFFNWKKTSMLPMVIPGLQSALTWTVDWIRLRWFFVTVSTVLVAVGLMTVFFRGERMLDTEFRGGTQVTMQFMRDEATGSPKTLTRPQAEEIVHRIGESAQATDVLRPLIAAEVSPVNPAEDGVTSSQFVVKTIITEKDAVTNALTAAFSEYLESKPPLAFEGSNESDIRKAPAYRILSGRLGDNIDLPAVTSDVTTRIGGIAIVLKDLHNAQTGGLPTLQSLTARLESMRSQQDFSDILARLREVRVIEGTEQAVSAAVVIVQDPSISFLTNEARFDSEVARREWALTREALTRAISPASVQSFSPAIAANFQAQAIVATGLSFAMIAAYIWFRFKSFRYGFAAIIALMHDVLAVLGLLALAAWLAENPSTTAIASRFGLMPFKIDLNMVAALLTVAGFSLNDTIIIMDRIRENRGKMLHASASMINNAINQTISRTLITSGTTLMSSVTLYVAGGEGVRAFAFALTAGVIVGTYSSVAVAAPIIWSRKLEREAMLPVTASPASA